MSRVYKQLTTQDTITTPFIVNKSFTFSGDSNMGITSSGIDILIGKNITSSIFDPDNEVQTGNLKLEYERLVYKSIKQLYYSNYLSQSYGDNVKTSSYIPNQFDTSSVDIYGTAATDNPSYYNYLSTTLTQSRIFSTASDSLVGVISIPSNLFGEYIHPSSFELENGLVKVTDDGEGNLLMFNKNVGNIIYEHGMAIITAQSFSFDQGYSISNYNSSSLYGYEDDIKGFLGRPLTCSFKSTLTKYEYQIKCSLLESEYNFSINPTLISSSIGTPYDYVTKEYFNPYITAVGLYNDSYDLIAIAKMSQPIPTTDINDTNIIVNLDMF